VIAKQKNKLLFISTTLS